ncbi:bifunctional hydroxymethylpyrimidine kinase/phosphomethylpyrimidine kinase [Microbacterium sp. NPDC077184]|uniref:bifunctional hydroxymethylpyrimidine kinase/phosphomethylpyrimidine kinase n=1 Tax=Microbacterium sp. NPDC077184 TaxID=3154764 RepID=UPI00342D332D
MSGRLRVVPRAVPRVLSVAGTDPTGGAGVQADLKSIAANGGYGMAVVTALVAQNTRGVRAVHMPPVEFLAQQLDAVSDDVAIDAVKIGMLGTVEVIHAVEEWLVRVRPPVVVLDPVMIATSGDRLLDREAEEALRALVARVDLVTPNIPELAILAGEPVATGWDEVLAQAARVADRHGVCVLAKGGHLGREDGGQRMPDALVSPDGDVVEFSGIRIDTSNTHGTGCSLSAALATRVARTGDWATATAETKRWLAESIRHGAELEVGHGNGPVSHFAGLWARGGLSTRPTPEAVRNDWWEEIATERAAIDALPFVRGLGDGTLARDEFTAYLAQDALYLRDYARVLAEASRRAPDQEAQAFWALGAHGALAAEMQLHESWLGESAGTDAVTPAPVTVAYLDHLLAVAARGDYAVLIAGLLPCFWLYQDVGTRLHALSHADHPYRSWLDTYGDAAFAASTARAIEIVTTAAAAADEGTRAAMLGAFLRSSRHEVAFFAEAGKTLAPAARQRHAIVTGL